MTARFKNWLLLNPLARYALAAIGGIIYIDLDLSEKVGTQNFLWVLASIGLFCFLKRFRIPRELFVFVIFMGLHQNRIGETFNHPLHHALKGMDRVEATVVAYLTPFPPAGGGGDGGRQQVTLETTSIHLQSQQRPMTTHALLRGWMSSREPLPAAGIYEIKGRLRATPKPTNPGEYDGTTHALRQGIVADMDVRSVKLIKLDSFPLRTQMLKWAESCREWVSLQLERGIENQTEQLSLIRGMALGAIDDASSDIERPFRDTGTMHVFAVSGLHVALFSSIGWTFLNLIGVRRNHALFILIPGVFAYAFITGWRPSAARAAIMVAILMAATLFDRQSRLQNNLGAAALILLFTDTHQLFLPGFQLSFGVLWAIALLAGPVLTWLRPWTELDSFLPRQLANRSQRAGSWLRTSAASSLSVSSAAWLGSLPLMLWHFGVVTPVAIFANCLLVPMAFLVLAMATVSLLIAALQIGWALVISNSINSLFAKMMLGGAVLFSKVPGATITTLNSEAHLRATTELTVLHLPYGEASQHLRLGQVHWLLDTGTKKSFTRVVEPVLRLQGCSRLNGIVLSHSDIAHIGGTLSAQRDYGQPPLFLSSLEPWPLESSLSSLKQLLASSSASDLKLSPLAEGGQIDFGEGAKATVLYPNSKSRHDKGDDRALVLLLVIDGFRILWCNDAGFIAEKQIMERHLYKSLRCDVLIRNQHVSDYSALSEFLMAVAPRIIITSNVPFLDEQAMPTSLPEYAQQRNATLLDQDVHGAITLAIENDQLRATGFSTGHSTVLSRRR